MICPLSEHPGKQQYKHIIPSFCVHIIIPETGKDCKTEYCTKTARTDRAVSITSR